VTVTAPQLARRHAAGAETARGLLFTVLGEFVLPSGGSAWTAAFIDGLGRLGVEEKACRQALMRTAADGWLAPERVGRRTRWSLTASSEQLLVEGTERIYGFTAARQAWDGRWLVILARAPESERPARHRLRTRLTWAGFGNPAPGVWLSAHADRAAEAERVLAEAGLLAEAQIFVAERAGGGPMTALARQAWDLDDIERQYEAFLAEAGLLAEAQIFVAERAGGGPMTALARQAWDLDDIERQYEAFLAEFASPVCPDPLARVVELVHAWRRFPWIDPVLPAELLPDQWNGVRAAELFARRHAAWSAAATAEWHRISGSHADAGVGRSE
jgi:phenylacetic acid degradation operon negative regulatory protein